MSPSQTNPGRRGWRDPERVFIAMALAYDPTTWAFYLAAVVWWVVELGFGPLQLVVMGTVLEASLLLSEVPTGVVADRFSRKWSVVVSFALMAASIVLAAATTNYPVMLAAQAMFGIAWTFRSGADVAWLTDERVAVRRHAGQIDSTPIDESPVLLRRHRLGMIAGVAGVVAAMIFGTGSPRTVMIVSGLALGVSTLGFALAMTDHHDRDRRRRRSSSGGDQPDQSDREPHPNAREILAEGLAVTKRVPALRRLMVVMVLLGSGGEALDRLGFKQFLDIGDFGDGSLRSMGALFIVLALLAIVALWSIERAQARGVGLITIGLALLAMSSVGAAVAALVPGFGIAIGMAIQDPSREAFDPVADGIANERAPVNSRATVLSLQSQAHGLGEVVGGIALASLAEAAGIRPAIFVAAVLWGAAAAVARTINRPT